MKWLRSCNECGNEQKDKDPKGEMTEAYRNRKCKNCKSPALDYGSYFPETEEERANMNNWANEEE